MPPIVTVSVWQSAVDGILQFVSQVGQFAEIQSKTILPPLANSMEQRVVFSTVLEIQKMAFVTQNGETTFDSVGVEQILDCVAYCEWTNSPQITAENYVLFSGNRYKILSVENIGKLNGIFKIMLKLSGAESKGGSI